MKASQRCTQILSHQKRTDANKSDNIGGFNNDRYALFICKSFLIHVICSSFVEIIRYLLLVLYAAKSIVKMTRYLLPKMNSDGHDVVFFY